MYSRGDSLLQHSPPPSPGARYDGEAGLPHSEICGSKVAHTSPQLIAACHVLHRLCMPRHPPNALTSRLSVHTTNGSAPLLKDRALAAWSFVSASISGPHPHQPAAGPEGPDARRSRPDHGIEKTHSQCQRRRELVPPPRIGAEARPEFGSSWKHGGASRDRTDDLKLAKLALSQLSYGPAPCGSAPSGREPAARWWAEEDSNLRPHAYQACALTT
jgi:hypothetical protein